MSDKDEKLAKAFDSATTNGKLISLSEEQATAFIDTVVDQSKILKAARVVKMTKPNKDIAKLLDTGSFLQPGGRTLNGSVTGYDFGSEVVSLNTKEVTGKIRVLDEDLEDNPEGLSLTSHLLGIITKKIANELEYAGMFGIKKANVLTINDMFDGFRKRVLDAGQLVNAANTGLFATRAIEKAKFTKAFKALPTKFRTDALKFFCASDTSIDYSNLFDTSFNRNVLLDNVLGRPLVEVPLMPIDSPVPSATASTTTNGTTALGATTLNVTASTNFAGGQTIVIGLGTAYEQVRTVASVGSGTIVVTAALTQAIPAAAQTVTTCTLNGTDVLLTDGNNLIYGIQTQGMSFETYRVPNVGYDYFYKARIDFQVEEPLAAVLLYNLLNT